MAVTPRSSEWNAGSALFGALRRMAERSHRGFHLPCSFSFFKFVPKHSTRTAPFLLAFYFAFTQAALPFEYARGVTDATPAALAAPGDNQPPIAEAGLDWVDSDGATPSHPPIVKPVGLLARIDALEGNAQDSEFPPFPGPLSWEWQALIWPTGAPV